MTTFDLYKKCQELFITSTAAMKARQKADRFNEGGTEEGRIYEALQSELDSVRDELHAKHSAYVLPDDAIEHMSTLVGKCRAQGIEISGHVAQLYSNACYFGLERAGIVSVAFHCSLMECQLKDAEPVKEVTFFTVDTQDNDTNTTHAGTNVFLTVGQAQDNFRYLDRCFVNSNSHYLTAVIVEHKFCVSSAYFLQGVLDNLIAYGKEIIGTTQEQYEALRRGNQNEIVKITTLLEQYA